MNQSRGMYMLRGMRVAARRSSRRTGLICEAIDKALLWLDQLVSPE
ncbi:hypothetical protein [Burkholderia arboris]|nr:hypothetical protein [Burkholderia arboris]